VAVALEHPHDVVGPHGPGEDGAHHPEDVRPVPPHPRQVDPAPGEGVERPVVSVGIDAPPPLVGQVGQRRAVLDVQQLRQAEDQI